MAKLDLASSEWCQLIFKAKNPKHTGGHIKCVPIQQNDIMSLCSCVVVIDKSCWI